MKPASIKMSTSSKSKQKLKTSFRRHRELNAIGSDGES